MCIMWAVLCGSEIGSWKYLNRQKVLRFLFSKRDWVFGTNSDFLIPVSLQPGVVDRRYFKQWVMLDQIIEVWYIKGLHLQVEKRKIDFVPKTRFLHQTLNTERYLNNRGKLQIRSLKNLIFTKVLRF